MDAGGEGRVFVLHKCRDSGKLKRTGVEGLALSHTVAQLRDKVVKDIGLPDHGLDVVFRGVRLKGEQKLSEAGLRYNCSVHLVPPAPVSDPPAADDAVSPARLNNEEYGRLILNLQNLVRNARSDFSHKLHDVTSSEEFMKKLIETTPGLESDVVAQNVLRDPELIFAFLENFRKNTQEHPTLFVATTQVIQEMMKRNRAAGGANYSLGDSDDDDDMLGNLAAAAPGGGQQRAGTAITPDQLQQALAMATGMMGSVLPSARPPTQQQSQRGGAGPSSAGPASQGAAPPISADFLQRAIQQASTHNYASQLQQMREIGIQADELQMIQALQVSGGDMQAAINLLLSGDI